MADLKKNVVVTEEVRLSFVNAFEPRAIKEGDEPKYSVTCIIPKSDTKTYERIKAAIQAVAEASAQKHFGGKVPTDPMKISTLKDGDTDVDSMGELKKNTYPEYANSWVIRVSSKNAPKVLNPDKSEMLDQEELYSGCYGKVSMTFFAYSANAKRGISASLGNIMKTRDGEPLVTRLTGDEFDI